MPRIDILKNFIEQVSTAISIPEMVMRINDPEIGFQYFLLHQ